MAKLTKWLDEPEDMHERIARQTEEEADVILEQSEYKDFDVDDSEVDGESVKYFDEEGNCVHVNTQTKEVHYFPKDLSLEG